MMAEYVTASGAFVFPSDINPQQNNETTTAHHKLQNPFPRNQISLLLCRR